MTSKKNEGCCSDACGSLKIGWATGSITPDRPANLFGMFNERISTHVAEPCMATALALEGADGTQAIWFSCDILNIPLDVTNMVRDAVAASIPGFNSKHLIISCTHTHNAPNFYNDLFPPPPPGVITVDEYRAFFIEQAKKIAVEAWQARKEGRIAPALGHAVLGWCRRIVFADGTGQMYGNSTRDDFVRVEGPMDPGVEVLFTYDSADVMTGAAINIACTAQTCMGNNSLTADLWAPVRRNLRAMYGENFQVLGTSSASGDQCPDDLIRWGRSEPQLRGPEGAEALARRLAAGVAEALEYGRREACASPVFRHIHAQVELPLYVMNDSEVGHYKKVIADLSAKGEPDPSSWDGGTLARARKHLERHEAMPPNPHVTIDCNFLRIGDVALATNPFELFLEYGQRIKARSPAVQTVVTQLTNDRQHYLPTAEAMKHGHYSAMPSNIRVTPAGGDLLVNFSIEQLRKLWAP